MTSAGHALPRQLAQFEIIQRLGEGGMAEVFLAKKRGAEGTFKILVVKRILPTYGTSRRFRAMFIEEAQLATRLNHPNVVQVYEFYDGGGEEGQLLAMEYVEGCDLGRLLSGAKSKGTRISPTLGAWVIAEAAKGLHYAHEKKDEAGQQLEIVHRDVSPQNILLSYEGSVKIADFGIATAKLFVEEAGVIKGKFGYMSPEQARGERVDRRSDVYALGVILWEILTGRPLHGGLGGEALLDIVRSGNVEAPSSYVQDVPGELEAIAMKALDANREKRFATARDVASALSRVLLQRQELIDAATLEAAITSYVTRENTRPGLTQPPVDAQAEALSRHLDARTQAAVPMARGAHGSSPPPGRSRTDPPPPMETIAPKRGAVEGPREVRHVAVVTLRLHGLDALEETDSILAQRTLDRLRTMLGDLAFKRGMRWMWTGDREGRAIAGLASNPARAAADAAWLALDTHEAIAGFKEDLPSAVGASIGIVRGIASGTRDREGHLVKFKLHDPATQLADLLGQETPMLRTWVAGGVYRLVRREFRWGDAPTLDVPRFEGVETLPSNMRIYALERSLSREERMQEASNASNDLVGRDPEKADLHAAYHQAVNGAAGAGELTSRAVIGEMGIGKTALVATFLSELPPNARVVQVECPPARMEVPFSSVSELIRDAIGARQDDAFSQVQSAIAALLRTSGMVESPPGLEARLAELASNRPFAGDEEEAFSRKKLILVGVRAILTALARQQHLVVVLEGLQWADKASLDLFSDLVHANEMLPMLILVVARMDERVESMLEGVMRIELSGLTSEEQVRLVETRLGVRDGVKQVCADVVPRVAGNPFFLLEMVEALLERGALEIREQESDGETQYTLVRTEQAEAGLQELPSTLEQLLIDRIRELPREEKTVVDWLAIAGGPLSVTDLVTLAGVDEETVVRLCARGICDRRGDVIDCRHPLTRDVAYIDLDLMVRIRMHRALGEHLAKTSLGRGLSAAIVARHLARGEAGERAAGFYLEAANAARHGYQTQLAIRYFQRALALLPTGDRRAAEAHDALEATYRVLGRRRDRLKHLEALRKLARKLSSPRVVCLALLRTSRFLLDEGQLQRGLGVARNAAEAARKANIAHLEIESEALVSEFLRELGDVQGALAACDRALRTADPNMNPTVSGRQRAEVLRSRGVLLRRLGRVREAVDAYVDAIVVFRRAGARRFEARAKNSLAYAMFVQGRYEDAIALALESIQIDLSIGGRFQIAKTLTNIGHAYVLLGDLPRGLAYLKRAREAHERYGDQDGRADTLLVSGSVMLEAGDLPAAEAFIGDAGALIAATGNEYDRTNENIVRAKLARALGTPDDAIARALDARRSAETQTLVAYVFHAYALEAAARMDCGEVEMATALATRAISGVETLQGCEFGLEIRYLCADILLRAESPEAPKVRERALEFAIALMNTIRDSRLKKLFAQKPMVANLLQGRPTSGAGSIPVGSVPPTSASGVASDAVSPRYAPRAPTRSGAG